MQALINFKSNTVVAYIRYNAGLLERRRYSGEEARHGLFILSAYEAARCSFGVPTRDTRTSSRA